MFWAFACSYLIVTIGYVHGTLMLAVMYIAVLVGGLATGQQRRGLLAVLGCGALTALVTITVYLPSALTADVTVRAQRGITNSDFLSPDLAGIVSSVSPEALTVLPGWWPDGYAPAPILYVAWFLPVLAFVDWSTARRYVAETVDLLVVLAVSLFFVLGPSDIGPLRFPVRLLPYAALSAIVLVVVLLARALARPVTTGRLIAALGWVAVATYLTWAGRPPTWEILGLSAVLTAAGLVATRWSLASRTGVVDWRRVGLVMIVVTVGLSTVQRVVSERSPLPDFGLTTDVDGYRIPPPVARNDVVIVGSASAHLGDPALWQETLLGNIWYVSDASVQNVYTPVAFAAVCGRHVHELARGDLPRPDQPAVHRAAFDRADAGRPALHRHHHDVQGRGRRCHLAKPARGVDARSRPALHRVVGPRLRRRGCRWRGVDDRWPGADGAGAHRDVTRTTRRRRATWRRKSRREPSRVARIRRDAAPRSPSPWTATCSRSTSPTRARGRW